MKNPIDSKNDLTKFRFVVSNIKWGSFIPFDNSKDSPYISDADTFNPIIEFSLLYTYFVDKNGKDITGDLIKEELEKKFNRKILSFDYTLLSYPTCTWSSYMTSQTDCTTGKVEGIRRNRRFYSKNGAVLDADWNGAINIAQKSNHPFSFYIPLDGAIRTWKAGCLSTTRTYVSLPMETAEALQAHCLQTVGS